MALGLTPQQIIDKNSHPLLKIHSSWKRVELKEIAKVQNGYAFSSNLFSREKGVPLIRIRDITKADTENLYDGEYSDEYIVRHNDILVGMDGDFLASKWPGESGLLNQRVCRLIFDSEFYNKNFFYICLQPYLNAINQETSSVTVKHLSSRTINEIPLPLPPLPEQRAIVSKIEQLFSELDNAVLNLKQAKDRLEVYRQSVLKKAFEGELTKEWRKKHGVSDKWEKVKLEDLGVWKGGGTPSKSNEEFWENGDVLWVSPKDMKTDIIRDTQDKITETAVENSSAKWIEEGSILFVVRSGIIRRLLPVAIAGKKLTTNQDMMSLNLNEKAISKFVYWYCKSEDHEIREKCAKDGTTVDNINSGLLKSYPISKPDIKEQEQIVKEIEMRFSVADKLAETIDESLEKAEALRQSILKKAFEGELLSKAELDLCRKEADWESADKLLERIRNWKS